MKKAGFIALIGEPNAGKSTLLNHMVGAKVSIVTHKVQTTRSRIRGLLSKLMHSSYLWTRREYSSLAAGWIEQWLRLHGAEQQMLTLSWF